MRKRTLSEADWLHLRREACRPLSATMAASRAKRQVLGAGWEARHAAQGSQVLPPGSIGIKKSKHPGGFAECS